MELLANYGVKWKRIEISITSKLKWKGFSWNEEEELSLNDCIHGGFKKKGSFQQ